MDTEKCANVDCRCGSEVTYDRAGAKFCGATCADAYEAKNLADAMCGCAHETCGKS